MYGRLSETSNAAESVPTQLDRGTDQAARRGSTVVATFKDDVYSASKEIAARFLVAHCRGGWLFVLVPARWLSALGSVIARA